jgi:hypothetical protein
MSFITLYTPLTDIVIAHIFYINETTPSTLEPANPPNHPSTSGQKHFDQNKK